MYFNPHDHIHYVKDLGAGIFAHACRDCDLIGFVGHRKAVKNAVALAKARTHRVALLRAHWPCVAGRP